MLHIEYLLQYAKGKEPMYNKIADKLWVEFDITSAELTLLILYIAYELQEDINDDN